VQIAVLAMPCLENQRYRASGLNLTIAAIVLWNTIYLSHAIAELCAQGGTLPDKLLRPHAPVGWEHISFNSDYVWPFQPLKQGFRPLRNPRSSFLNAAYVRFGPDSAMTPSSSKARSLFWRQQRQRKASGEAN
jgi:Tn3 transposase DDE domain